MVAVRWRLQLFCKVGFVSGFCVPCKCAAMCDGQFSSAGVAGCALAFLLLFQQVFWKSLVVLLFQSLPLAVFLSCSCCRTRFLVDGKMPWRCLDACHHASYFILFGCVSRGWPRIFFRLCLQKLECFNSSQPFFYQTKWLVKPFLTDVSF